MEPFLGEIRLMGGNYAPKGWALCNGQALPVAQNTALFSLLGTMYGGNGQTAFNLPDLRGRVALGFGQAPGLQQYSQGYAGGAEGVTLNSEQLAQHFHPITAGTVKIAATPTGADPAGNYPATSPKTQYTKGAGNAFLNGGSLSGSTDANGGNQPHNNLQPVMAMNYCIAIQGIFPSRG